MSHHNGKQTANAVLTFNGKAKTPQTAVIEKLARTLQKRTLGTQHMDEAARFLTGIRDAAQIKIFDTFEDNHAQRLADRVIRMGMMYMGVKLDETGVPVYDEYFPMMCKTNITPEIISFAHRAMPVTFSSQHTEFRFIQRTAEVLDYQGEDFKFSISTMLFMATRHDLLIQNDTDVVSVSLPHPQGFFLGKASKADYGRFFPDQAVVAARRHILNGMPFVSGLDGEKIPPECGPHVNIDIRTFVSTRQFSARQRKLHGNFVEALAGPVAHQALETTMDLYPLGLLPNAGQKPYDTRLHKDLATIIGSPEWKHEQEKGSPHVMNRELH